MARGGKRKGAGRKRGKKEPATLEKERVLAEVRNKIMKRADRLVDAQTSLGLGQSFLYRIDTITDGKGKTTRSKPMLVESPEEISNYLDGQYEDEDDRYYYITTKEPNNQAIDSMMNRSFGKPTESVELSGKDGGAIPVDLGVIIKKVYGTDEGAK